MEQASALLKELDIILIGAGAGASAAAGRYYDFLKRMEQKKGVLLEL